MRNQFFICCLFSFILLWTVPLQLKTYADSNALYQVEADHLHVRSSPSSDAQIIGYLEKGQQVSGLIEENGWVQTYYDENIAWVAINYLLEVENDASINNDSADEISIAAANVNIRSGPGTDHAILGVATAGDTYELIDSVNDWVNISLSQDDGWIASELTNQSEKDDSSTNQPSKNPSSKHLKQEKTGKKLEDIHITLDPGHGGKDPGAIGVNHVQEKDLVEAASNHIAEQLREEGATVTRTRSQDEYSSLDQRIAISHDHETDAFVSIHFDASEMSDIKGTSTYYYEGGADQQLAQSIQQSLANVTDVNDRGVKQGNYKVLRKNENLGVLIELGFISNPEELAVMESENFQNQAAEAITKGLVDYFQE